MANQDSAGFIEQHVEKLVLAISVGVLVFAVSHWVLGSPRQVEVLTSAGSTSEVSPAELDEKLNEAAESIWRRHSNATAEVEPVYPGPEHFERLASTPFSPALDDLGYLAGGSLPDIDIGGGVTLEAVGVAQVADEIPAPSAPSVWVGQELRRVTEGDLSDQNIAHGAADFDWQTMTGKWQALLRPRGINARPVALRVEVQRQLVLPDGTYGPAETIRTIRAPGPEGQVARVPELPDFTGENTQAIADTIDQIEQAYQLAVLRPRYWEVWWGGTNQWISWKRHLPATATIDAYAKLVAAPEVDDPDGGTGRPIGEEEDRRPSRRRAIRGEEEAEARYGRAVEDGGRRSPPIGREDEERRGGRTRRPPVRREDERRDVREDDGVDTGELASGAAPPPMPAVPPLGRLVQGKNVLWFHDAGLELRKQYRYRLRMVFVNPLYGKQISSVVKSPDDIRTKEVASPWSQWSATRRVPHPTEFFLTGYDSTSGTVQVTVFTRHMGRFIRQRFNVRSGQSIGESTQLRVPVPTLDGQTSREIRTVDFSTAAVAMEVDFSREVPSWGNITTTTVALIYLDENGKVQTRVRSRDEASDRYQELDSLAP